MNERGHVTNAALLSIGLGILLEPALNVSTALSIATIGPPIVLGALLPDIDTSFGTHRKTLHNLPVLLLFVAFPLYFGNLEYVWVGVLTHYVLDLLGNVKGMAIFYPLPGFYDVPVGVPVGSRWADVVTLLVTAVELGLAAVVVRMGGSDFLGAPDVVELVRQAASLL